MNTDITFSLLNFSTPAEVKALNAKPSSSKFSKLSSTKKKTTSSTKENIGSNENVSPNRNVSKNLLSTYNDNSKAKSPQGILKERNNIFDNNSNCSKNKLSSFGSSDKVSGPNHKLSTYQKTMDQPKRMFVKESKSGSMINVPSSVLKSSKENTESAGSQNDCKNHTSHENPKSRENKLENSNYQESDAKSCNRKLLDKIKKCDSLSTSFSSLDTSEPKVGRSANKIAPKKLTESIISISSSPEGDQSFYESLNSFFPVKNCKTKKLVSSTPRCSQAFFSPADLSGNFESAGSTISKENENAFLSKCSVSTKLTKGGGKLSFNESKKDSEISNDKGRKILTDISNKETEDFTNHSAEKRSILKNSSRSKVDPSKSSTDQKFDALFNSSDKSSVKGTSQDKFEVLLSSTKTKNLSSEEKFEALKNSNNTDSFDKQSKNVSRSQISSEDNCSRRFKSTDESRIVSDTLKFRGITIRRHRRLKVLGLQKDFMYEETSSSSEEDLENHCPNSPDLKKGTSMNNSFARKSYFSNDSSSPIVRKHRSKRIIESSKDSPSSLFKSSEANEALKTCARNSNLNSETEMSHGRLTRSKKLDDPSLSLSSSSSSLNQPSRKLKSASLSSKGSQDSFSSLSIKSKQPLGSSKSSTEKPLTSPNKSSFCPATRGSSRKKSSSFEISDSESLLDAEKLLNELYGSTWHDKKDAILPRSSVKKKPPKEKPKTVTRVTLNFSDESDTEINFKKKTPRKKKQDSFINDDSSLSESGDLNFYRTLSNKLPLSSTKPKLRGPLSSSSEDLPSALKKKTLLGSSLESPDNLDVSLKNKNSGVLESTKKGKVKKSPSFVARKTKVLTSTSNDTKFKKPVAKKLLKSTPAKDLYVPSDSESGNSDSDSFVKGSKRPIVKKGVKQIVNTPIRPDLKKLKVTPSKTPKEELPRLSFLSSLSALADETRLHPDAAPYKKFYKTKKEELARRLLILYNKEIFESRLPDDMLIQWNARMRSTSGYCYNKKVRRTGLEMARVSRIVLSTKILDTPERLRDTLLHEMCHSAAWIINGAADGHGPLWKGWANKAMRRFPEVPPIKRCHDYSIKTKFTYRCTSCGYSIGRHSKSLDITRKRCGYCYGAFELLVNHSKSNRKSAANLKAPRAPGKFALFVKENYSEVKKQNLQKTHAEIMKLLGQQFSIVKNQVQTKE